MILTRKSLQDDRRGIGVLGGGARLGGVTLNLLEGGVPYLENLGAACVVVDFDGKIAVQYVMRAKRFCTGQGKCHRHCGVAGDVAAGQQGKAAGNNDAAQFGIDPCDRLHRVLVIEKCPAADAVGKVESLDGTSGR